MISSPVPTLLEPDPQAPVHGVHGVHDVHDVHDVHHADGHGWNIKVAIDGRQLTGWVHLASGKNPRHRDRCRVLADVPASWSHEETLAALRVAARWFSTIGGFAQVTHRQLCHLVARLKVGHSEQAMHWAVAAYARSPWHAKHPAARTTIGRFFQGERFEHWLEESADYQEWCSKRACEQDLLREQREMQDMRRRAGGRPISALSDDQLREECRKAAEDAIAAATNERQYHNEMDKVCHQAWEALPEEARAQVLAVVRRHQARTIPEQRQHLGDGEFRRAVHRCAHVRAESMGLAIPQAPSPPAPSPGPRPLPPRRPGVRDPPPRRASHREHREHREDWQGKFLRVLCALGGSRLLLPPRPLRPLAPRLPGEFRMIRSNGNLQRAAWTAAEDQLLRDYYPRGGRVTCLQMLPGRSRSAIINRVIHLGLRVEGCRSRQPDPSRAQIALEAAAIRAANDERLLQSAGPVWAHAAPRTVRCRGFRAADLD